MKIQRKVLSIYLLFSVIETKELLHAITSSVSLDFNCSGRQMGYYADLNTNCRAYHTCDEHGNHFIHYCPEDTAFRQDAMICDYTYHVDCQSNGKSVKYTTISPNDSHNTLNILYSEIYTEGTNVINRPKYFSEQNLINKSAIFGISKNYEENPDATILSHSSQLNHLITTTEKGIFTDYQSSTKLLKITKTFSNDYYHQLYFPFQQHIRNINDNFSKSLKISDFISKKNIHNILQIERENNNTLFKNTSNNVDLNSQMKMIFNTLTKKEFGTESNSNVHNKKTVNSMEQKILKSNLIVFPKFNFSIQNDNNYKISDLIAFQNHKTKNSTFMFNNSSDNFLAVLRNKKSKLALTLPVFSDRDQDPYYPKYSTTTEIYYTPKHQSEHLIKPYFVTTSNPLKNALKNVNNIKIISLSPNFNNLEDLLDRKKFFFIPRLKTTYQI